MNKSTIARIGALATTVALAAGIVTATAGTAQAVNIGGDCVTVINDKPVKVNCETGKPISTKQQNRKANGGWDIYEAQKSDGGVFEVPLPKYLRGQDVTVTVKYTSTGTTDWLLAIDPAADATLTRTADFRVTGSAITVAMPTSDYAGCHSLFITVKSETGKAYKYRVAAWGFSEVDYDNGYRDITIKP